MSTSVAALHSVHVLATMGMVGLIWFVQVVHYPLFAAVGPASFVDYELAHTRRTSWVVGPLMAAEGLTAVILVADPGPHLDRVLPLTGLFLLAVIHASTVFLQVPAHRRLSAEADPATMRRLVRTNWIRTIGWSARAILAMAMLLRVAEQ